jgi:hypothetical protein
MDIVGNLPGQPVDCRFLGPRGIAYGRTPTQRAPYGLGEAS